MIATPDVNRGQVPIAFVTLRPNATVSAAELTRFLADYLSRLEIPKTITIRDSLPKTAIGKIDRKVLIEEERIKREAKAHK